MWKDIIKKEISNKIDIDDLEQAINNEIFDRSDYTDAKASKLESLLQRKFNNDGIEVSLVEEDRCFYIDLFNTDELGDYDDKDKIASYQFDYNGNFSKARLF